MITSTPAGVALNLMNNSYGGGDLMQRTADETAEVRRKRTQGAKAGGYSPAGQALAIDFGSMSVPGAAQ
ncbi:hypothetical protein [Bradyrhizobium sp. WSM1253]|uniref:hypothetical protein n=1 Tax=Bradyrhizobium sp. WSM1253 TaxID=319003 RepID=UPI00025D1852|nr:hypothetical protein [Bradyrhizobium sp. WSM1253]EIG56081.1 hypothetical protein Bra1253DRAFT_00689 [Bradyrhizobium sp. WSM1253]